MQTVTDKVEIKDVVLNLRKHAHESQVFSAMAHIFAMRERTRQQIVVTTLYNTMVKEGFKFSKDDLRKELEYMGFLGLGKVYRSSKGKVEALKNIGVTLQSVGMAAISKQDTLAKLRISTRFAKLPVIEMSAESKNIKSPEKIMPKKLPDVQHTPKSTPTYKAVLIIESDGRKREINLSNKITAEKLLDVISALQAGA